MPEVIAKHPECELVLVGDGELRDSVAEESRMLGVADHIHFTGVRCDIEELYQAMDLLVSSSLWEGLPTVIIEAVASRVPVVCTSVSGSVELVRNGITGLVVPPGSPSALTEAILQLIDDMGLAKEMADRAFVSARRFSIVEVAAQYARLFLDCGRSSQADGIA